MFIGVKLNKQGSRIRMKTIKNVNEFLYRISDDEANDGLCSQVSNKFTPKHSNESGNIIDI